MNASQSPILNISSPFPGSESASLRSGESRPNGSGGSFDAVYDNEKLSSGKDNASNTLNNNMLDDRPSTTRPATRDASDTSDADDRAAIASDESSFEDTKTPLNTEQDQGSELATDGAAIDEQALDETLISGIGVAPPMADTDTSRGELLPASGKRLPVIAAGIMKEAPLAKTFSDAETLELMDQSDQELDRALFKESVQNAANRNPYGNGSNDLLEQDRVARLTASSADFFNLEDAMDLTPGKNSAEAMLENLAFLSSMSSREAPSTTVPNNPLTATTIAAPNLESQLSSVQALSSGSTEGLDASLNVRGNSTDWSQAIGDKIRWMRNASVSTAELHLNPAELGSIEIKIVTEDQQARVSFITSSPAAQEMIEESLSKLKEMLSDHGIALDQSDIGQKGSQNEFAQDDRRSPASEPAVEKQFEHEATLSTSSPVTSRIGQVDHYV